jgi:hypothetical protein
MSVSKETKKATRVSTTLDFDTHSALAAWSQKLGITQNDFLKDAVVYYNKYCNKDFDIPDLLTQRMNQVVDGMNVLSSNLQAVMDTMNIGFDSIVSLARGDNYLLEPDDGKL